MEDLVNQYVWDIVQDKTDQAIDTLFEEVHGEVGTRSVGCMKRSHTTTLDINNKP